MGCHLSADKAVLVRFVRLPNGLVELDASGKQPGRGTYICPQLSCFEAARRSRRLNRALHTEIDKPTWESLAQAFLEMCPQGTKEQC